MDILRAVFHEPGKLRPGFIREVITTSAAGEIAELQIDAYPLGVRPDTRYAAIKRQLGPGDYLVFCSDGIIEAADGTGAQFGYERTAATLRSGCSAGLSAEALLERVVAEVRGFRGETPQGDDQTVVVLRVGG